MLVLAFVVADCFESGILGRQGCLPVYRFQDRLSPAAGECLTNIMSASCTGDKVKHSSQYLDIRRKWPGQSKTPKTSLVHFTCSFNFVGNSSVYLMVSFYRQLKA